MEYKSDTYPRKFPHGFWPPFKLIGTQNIQENCCKSLHLRVYKIRLVHSPFATDKLVSLVQNTFISLG